MSDLSRRSAFGAKADRDRKLELALKHQLQAAGTPDRDRCVDVETLSAWTDGGLDAAQMAAVDLHVADCARCQSIAGAMARGAELAPSIEAVESATPGAFSLWKWWLAPLAAGAAAVTLWMVVPRDTMQTAEAPVIASHDRSPVAQDAASQAKKNTAPPAPPALQDRAERVEERSANLGATAAAPAATAPPAAEAMLQKSARLATAPLEIVSPDPSRRWRIANGAIERSEDAGATWIAVRSITDSITAGTAPAPTICWLIGSSGVVLLTTDGVTFTRVPLPERVDLTAITATDARSATVTAADGRRFRTGDGGRSWSPIQA